jgi:hypothetical protein
MTKGQVVTSSPDFDLANLASLANEDLHPDLEPYLEDATFGPCLKHPLVFQVPFYSPGLANRTLEAKRKALKLALEQNDLGSYIFLHERPYRFEALMRLEKAGRLVGDAEAAWLLIRNVWINSENVWQHYDEWVNLLSDPAGQTRLMMTDEEEAALAALTDVVPIYRGATLDLNEEGLSWTLEHERAEWFARCFAEPGEQVVIHATVLRDNIVAHFTSRSEAEILALPDDITVVKYEDPSL